MKKLQKLVLNKAVKMTSYQMKQITGGYGTYGTCCIKLGHDCASCGWSRDTVEPWATMSGTNWCCDSCDSASWTGRLC